MRVTVTAVRDRDRTGSLARYVTRLDTFRWPPTAPLDSATPPTPGYRGWRRVALAVIPERTITPVRVAVTHGRMALGTRRRIRRAPVPVRLHLACGEHRVDGWLNIDLAGSRADHPWDLRRPLPLDEGSVAAIFHEHFLEHLPLADALDSIRRWHALLRPGGILRIGVPDAGRYLRDYAHPDGFLESLRPGRPTPLTAVAELVYCYGHRSLWDLETLRLALHESGFTSVTEMAPGESALQPAPDTPERAEETLYVEAVKPA